MRTETSYKIDFFDHTGSWMDGDGDYPFHDDAVASAKEGLMKHAETREYAEISRVKTTKVSKVRVAAEVEDL